MSRVTITRRHTGRLYIGVDEETFRELAVGVISGEAVNHLMPPKRRIIRERLQAAFKKVVRLKR